jgi:small subunit ribosomal protein S6
MRTYELVLVFDPGLEVEVIETDLRKLSDMISANGMMRRWERWGKRRLSYEIRGRQYGYYVLAVFDTEAPMVAELDRTVRINSAVIRHLITLVEPKRVPEADLESIRTLGAAPEVAPEPPAPVVVAAEPAAEPAAPAAEAAPSPESAA